MTWLQILFLIAGIAIVFLLIREVVTWYWKINEITDNQRKTNELLREQNELLRDFVEDFTNK